MDIPECPAKTEDEPVPFAPAQIGKIKFMAKLRDLNVQIAHEPDFMRQSHLFKVMLQSAVQVLEVLVYDLLPNETVLVGEQLQEEFLFIKGDLKTVHLVPRDLLKTGFLQRPDLILVGIFRFGRLSKASPCSIEVCLMFIRFPGRAIARLRFLSRFIHFLHVFSYFRYSLGTGGDCFIKRRNRAFLFVDQILDFSRCQGVPAYMAT